MLRILFWNINNNDLSNHIINIVVSNDVDIVILAESVFSEDIFISELSRFTRNPFHRVSGFSKLKTFCNSRVKIKPFQDTGRISIYRLFTSPGFDIIIAAIHLQSKMYQNETEQIFSAVRLREIIEKAEKENGHSRTIVVGDFNMNPFEPGMVGADCLNSVIDKKIAERRSRIIQGENRKYFYNPMWNFLGDMTKGPPGSYYYNSGRQINYYWNLFDQILVRPDLLDFFDFNTINIVTETGGVSLLSDSGKPDKIKISDHLPLMFSLNV